MVVLKKNMNTEQPKFTNEEKIVLKNPSISTVNNFQTENIRFITKFKLEIIQI